MCFDYDDYNQAHCETWRRARKPHRCASCRRVIGQGDKYADTTGIDPEGKPFRLRACARCMAQQEAIRQQELADGCPNHSAVCAIEEIADYVREAGTEWVSDEVALAFADDRFAKQQETNKALLLRRSNVAAIPVTNGD